MAKLDAVLDQRLLEGERAAQHEGDQIVAPVAADIGRLVDQLAAAKHAVARHVGADVEVLAERGKPEVAGRGGRQQRARLGIELAEAQEIARQAHRQDGEVALHVARRNARGLPAERTRADRQPRLPTGARKIDRGAEAARKRHGVLRSCAGPRAPARLFVHLIIPRGRENRLNMAAGSRLLGNGTTTWATGGLRSRRGRIDG